MAVRLQCPASSVLKKMLYFDSSIDYFPVFLLMKSSLSVMFHQLNSHKFSLSLNGSLLEVKLCKQRIECLSLCLKIRKGKGLILESELFNLKLSSLLRTLVSGKLLEEGVDQQDQD